MRLPDRENETKEEKSARIRFVKRLLRYMPRRAMLHKYPIISWFSESARKRHYLWSFRQQNIVPALYAGFILTFMPVMGIQLPLAFLLAWVFRANFMVLAGLQFLSNPLTVVPIYALDYQVGSFVLDLIGGYDPSEVEAYTGGRVTSQLVVAFQYYKEMVLGGAIVGYFAGLISVCVYRLLLSRIKR